MLRGRKSSASYKLYDLDLVAAIYSGMVPLRPSDNATIVLDCDPRWVDSQYGQKFREIQRLRYLPGFAVYHNLDRICL